VAWLEVRNAIIPPGFSVSPTHSGSPVCAIYTNSMECALLTIPAGYELAVTLHPSETRRPRPTPDFDATLRGPQALPGVYWLSWGVVTNAATVANPC
jgi:hypothetical protein